MSTANIQDIPEVRRVYLKANPFTILAGPIINTSEYRLGLELVGGNRFSYEVHASYLGKWILLNTGLVDDTTRSVSRVIEFPGFRVQGALRYYFVKNERSNSFEGYYQPSGLYLSLHASYAAASLQIRGQALPRQDWTNFQVMLRAGYQIITYNHIGVDLFMGMGYKQNSAVDFDIRNRRTVIDIRELVGPGLGDYIVSPIKVAMGFSFTVGIF